MSLIFWRYKQHPTPTQTPTPPQRILGPCQGLNREHSETRSTSRVERSRVRRSRVYLRKARLEHYMSQGSTQEFHPGTGWEKADLFPDGMVHQDHHSQFTNHRRPRLAYIPPWGLDHILGSFREGPRLGRLGQLVKIQVDEGDHRRCRGVRKILGVKGMYTVWHVISITKKERQVPFFEILWHYISILHHNMFICLTSESK